MAIVEKIKKEDDNYLRSILKVCVEFHRDHVANEGYGTDAGKYYGYAYRSAIELYMLVSIRIYPDKNITKEDVLLLLEKEMSDK